MFYLIDERLIECTLEDALSDGRQFVAIITPEEWARTRVRFDMGIELDPDVDLAFDSHAVANYDAITGTVFLPDRDDLKRPEDRFAFALDEKGIVLIDAEELAGELVSDIAAAKRWRKPSLERFLAELLISVMSGNTELLKTYDRELDTMERAILDDKASYIPKRIHEIRSELRLLDDHYDHLADLVQVLCDNENGFFKKSELHYLRITLGRIERLHDQARTLRDQAMQLHDLYKTTLEIRQNHIITLLTIVTAIFAPLTLIVGWYGMNFTNMPELTWRYGYPMVIIISLMIAIWCLVFFKHRKWL